MASPEQRIREAIHLQAFNLLLTIDLVRSQMPAATESDVLEEVNRRRLARSPMPQALCDRVHLDAEARPT